MAKKELFDYQLVGKRHGEREWHIVATITVPVENVSQALSLENAKRDDWVAEHRELQVQEREKGKAGWVIVDSMICPVVARA